MEGLSSIFLNADVGEGADYDTDIIPLVGGVNVCCGAHAGGAVEMLSAVNLAIKHDLLIGAHPGYPDLANYGRIEINLSPVVLKESLIKQLDNLAGVVKKQGGELQYIKPHGALYNRMAQDEGFATQVLRIFKDWSPLPVMVLANSVAVKVAKLLGIPVIEEGFLDRAYTDEGYLVPRSTSGAIITDVNAAKQQAQAFMEGKPIFSQSGLPLEIQVDTVCVHGDTEGAVSFLKSVLGK